jgi:hypothetical protein
MSAFFVVADSRSSVDKKAQFLCGFQQISGLYCTSAGALGSGEIGGPWSIQAVPPVFVRIKLK